MVRKMELARKAREASVPRQHGPQRGKYLGTLDTAGHHVIAHRLHASRLEPLAISTRPPTCKSCPSRGRERSRIAGVLTAVGGGQECHRSLLYGLGGAGGGAGAGAGAGGAGEFK
ncbi:MAG: hypothetical protein M1399_10065 [Actinobacteria bacterium]|nr:hypothetical protein [Actinomycetota bacterium]